MNVGGVMNKVARTLIVGAVAGTALATGAGVAHADSWHPWVPGIPGPGVNIGVPGNPLPPGQVKQLIPNVDDMVPNWSAPGQWR
jgi:hypothetical protein